MVMMYTSYLCLPKFSERNFISEWLMNLHALIIAFSCISEGKQFRILEEISLKCVKSAESIVNMSYSQAKVYTLVNILHIHYNMSLHNDASIEFFTYYKLLVAIHIFML